MAWDEVEEVIQTQANLKLNLEKQDPLKSFCQDNLYIDQCQLYDNWDSWQLQMFNSLSMLHDSVILGLSCPSFFFFFSLLFFCIWFTMNQAKMSDCTITCCEIYILWCCFRSVHCTVLNCVLGWIKDRGKGLTRSNKEHRASFFFGLREREGESLVILDLDLPEFVIFLWVKFVFICDVVN